MFEGVRWICLAGLLVLMGCGGGKEGLRGLQPPPGAPPGCQAESGDVDQRCQTTSEGSGRTPPPDVTRSPRGNAPNVGDDPNPSRGDGRAIDPPSNLGGPAPVGNAPGVEEPPAPDEEAEEDDDG
jgi:hypothetical protein